MLLSIPAILLIAASAVQLVYYLFLLRRSNDAATHTGDGRKNPKTFASIIICARNEYKNLQNNLPAVLRQQYHNEQGQPNYEVIVVNDASTDGSQQLLQTMQAQYPQLKVVAIQPGEARVLKGKKHAVSKGVNKASGQHLLFTDADCLPCSDQWLQQMMAPLEQGKQIVAGFGAYRAEQGWLNGFIRWETLHTYIQYAGYAIAGIPYMAVGRNMACTKAISIAAQTSDNWNETPSGDDDLLINALADDKNMAIVAIPTAHTLSDAKQSWREWLHQKQRHVSTGKLYKPGIILLLSGYAYSHAIMWVSLGCMLVSGSGAIALCIWLLRCLLYWQLSYSTAQQLKQPLPLLYHPAMDICWLLYNFLLYPYILFTNKKSWK